eukprot:1648487-Pyramimonas_sp.AAC.1
MLERLHTKLCLDAGTHIPPVSTLCVSEGHDDASPQGTPCWAPMQGMRLLFVFSCRGCAGWSVVVRLVLRCACCVGAWTGPASACVTRSQWSQAWY